jgi:hypothetical protein
LVGAAQEERALEEGRTRTTCPVENGESSDESDSEEDEGENGEEEGGDEEQ